MKQAHADIPSHVSRHLQKQKKSGMSIHAYCRNHSLSYSTFHYWRKRWTQPEGSTAGCTPIKMKEVGIFSLGEVCFKIHLPSGIELTMPTGIHREQLAEIMSGLLAGSAQC